MIKAVYLIIQIDSREIEMCEIEMCELKCVRLNAPTWVCDECYRLISWIGFIPSTNDFL